MKKKEKYKKLFYTLIAYYNKMINLYPILFLFLCIISFMK